MFLQAGLGAAVAASGYAVLAEPGWLEVARHHLSPGGPGEPVKILHLSDLHASWCVPPEFINQAIARGLALKPDLICLTGDFITSRFDDQDTYARLLAPLAQAAPTYACLGNHDGGRWAQKRRGYPDTAWVRGLLQKSGVQLLHNRTTELRVKGRTLRLTGLGDLDAGEVLAERAFAAEAGALRPYTVVLAHNPDTKEILAPYPWDLLLCGHTHGGQVCVPFFGPTYLPVNDRRFVAGLYPWRGRHIVISKGVGNIWGLRFDCRPDIGLITLA